MAMKIRSNDDVVVIAGKDKGKRGRVLRIDRVKGKVVVEGVNIITRHLKRNPQNPQAGGRVQRPAPIHVSNVMVWADAEGKGVRVGWSGTGRERTRVAKGSGKPIQAAGRKKAARKTAKKTATKDEA
jgi:large subunit ribosomal protein L24